MLGNSETVSGSKESAFRPVARPPSDSSSTSTFSIVDNASIATAGEVDTSLSEMVERGPSISIGCCSTSESIPRLPRSDSVSSWDE